MPAVDVATTGAVRTVRLNRPEKLNALNEHVRRGLHDAFTQLADETDVRVVVLEGAGRAFSAGADLAAGGAGDQTWAERRHAAGAWQRVLDLIESVPQVTVARLHGHVVHIPELAIGIPLTWAGVPRLVREVGLPMARDLVMTARKLDADEALACGFVQRVAPAADIDTATDALVQELLDMPAAPLAMTRSVFAAMSRERLGSTSWADADLLAWSLREPEGRQAAADYVQQRLRDKKRS